MLFLIYTGCRPAELVDAAKGKIAIGRDQTYEDVNWDNECEGLDETKDDGPIYENPEPWVDSKISDCDDKDDEDILTREYKALCYEDIRLWIVRNPTPGERDLLGMEITLAHHKGAYRKPKPYVLDLVFFDLANVIFVGLRSFFTKKLYQFFVLLAIS